MILRPLRWLFRLIVLVVALVALLLAVLWVTNPRPQRSSGWEQLADVPEGRGEVAAALANGELVVAGGLRGFGSTARSVSVYDVATDRWRTGPALPQARHHAAAAATERDVYISGGAPTATDWTPEATLWRSRPGGRWETLAEMPEGRQGHAMVTLRDRLYVVGGVGRSDRTLIYDISDARWSVGADLPEGRDHLRAVAWDGRVWALGGRSGGVLRRVDVYDPRRDTWAPGPDLPEPMSAMAVGVIGDALHVIGGEDPSLLGGVSDKHVVLREGSDRWEDASPPVLKVHGAGFGVHDDRLIVAGGASRQGAFSTISWTPVTQAFTP